MGRREVGGRREGGREGGRRDQPPLKLIAELLIVFMCSRRWRPVAGVRRLPLWHCWQDPEESWADG